MTGIRYTIEAKNATGRISKLFSSNRGPGGGVCTSGLIRFVALTVDAGTNNVRWLDSFTELLNYLFVRYIQDPGPDIPSFSPFNFF